MIKGKEVYIEEKKFKNRSEFRIVINDKYEKYLTYYAGVDEMETTYRPYKFTAYKKGHWFRVLFFGDYEQQYIKAMEKCEKLLFRYKKTLEKPKVIKHENTN